MAAEAPDTPPATSTMSLFGNNVKMLHLKIQHLNGKQGNQRGLLM
jgi:hypothetical protein